MCNKCEYCGKIATDKLSEIKLYGTTGLHFLEVCSDCYKILDDFYTPDEVESLIKNLNRKSKYNNIIETTIFNKTTEIIWKEFTLSDNHKIFCGSTKDIFNKITAKDISNISKSINKDKSISNKKEIIINIFIDSFGEFVYTILDSIDKGIYRHFKGQYYQVIDCGINATNGEDEETIYVIYKALYGNNKTYVRKLSEFISNVNMDKHPLSTQKKTFKKLQFENINKEDI